MLLSLRGGLRKLFGILPNPFQRKKLKQKKKLERRSGGLEADKSPVPDSFPIFFYCQFWDVVKPNEGNLRLDRLNYAHVLKPKKSEVKKLGF